MPIRVDATRGSIVVTSFIGAISDAELTEYHDTTLALIRARRAPTVTIIDASQSVISSAGQRKLQAEWMRENQHLLAQFTVGIAFVIRSAIIRGAVQAVLWLQPLPMPHAVVTSLEQAEVWAEEMLRDRTVRKAG